MSVLPARRFARWPCVCLSVRSSQVGTVGLLSKLLNRSIWILAQMIPLRLSYTVLYRNSTIFKIRVLPSGKLSQTLDLDRCCRLKPGPHQQQRRSNIVEATGNFVACCFDNVALYGNKVERRFDIVASVDRALGGRSVLATVVGCRLSQRAPTFANNDGREPARRAGLSASADTCLI